MKFEYDEIADAVYVTLCDEPFAYTKSVDDMRNIDYSASHKPIGIEWLCVSSGIDLSGIPESDAIGKLLFDKSFKVYA